MANILTANPATQAIQPVPAAVTPSTGGALGGAATGTPAPATVTVPRRPAVFQRQQSLECM